MVNHRATSTAWAGLLRANWKSQTLPGMSVIGLVILIRVLGLFQSLEWRILDSFLRLRPAEPQDERLLIIGIDDNDIQRIGAYPIPDQDLAALLQRLLQDAPRVIGIDIFRDLPVEPGYDSLAELLETSPTVFGIEKITRDPIPPPPALPQSQVGFYDFPLDQDGFVRRTYLGAHPSALGTRPSPGMPDVGRFRFFLSLKLAEAYLAEQGLAMENGLQNPDNMRFGDTELFQFQPNSGGYVNTQSAGVQLLIHPRSGKSPFKRVSMTDVLEGRVDASLIRDRVVLIGITSLSATKDLINSAAVNTDNPGLFYGVEMHAHITSQIISAVLDNRPLLKVWGEGWEYGWILLWGVVGMLMGRFIPRPSRYILSVCLTGLGFVGTSLALLWLGGWWIPVGPTLIVFAVNGCVLPGFYLYDQTLRSRIDERQRVIEETYDAIHNGPLQTLALLLQQKETLNPATGEKLANLNQELRAIYTHLLQESLPQEEQLQLGSQRIVDLRKPFHEVLYEVYSETLTRDFPGFDSIKFQVVKFEPLQVEKLSSNDKRALCRFLEEALCNVGKHAIGVKQLTVLCLATDAENLIRVADDGKPNTNKPNSKTKGRGAQQAQTLAQRLQGNFQRTSQPTGTYCELRWPLQPPNRKWFR